MKKSWKLLLSAFSFAFVMFLAMGTTSKAAGWDAGLKQTAAGQKSIYSASGLEAWAIYKGEKGGIVL